MPELILKLGDQVLQTYKLENETINIGRSRDNDIVIENLGVSRNHARIRFHNDRYVLTDMNSANGTMVNGVKVSKTEIVDDDVVSIGKHKLHFRHHSVDESPVGGAFDVDHTIMVDPGQTAALVATEGRIKGREFHLTKFETTIGKAPGNDVVLSEEWWLAKKQAIIVRRGNAEFEIHDLGSIRKIRVNGSPITQPVLLRNSDVIDVGNVRFMFRMGDQPLIPTGRMPHEIEADDSVFEGKSRGDTAALPAAVGMAGSLAGNRSSAEYPVVPDRSFDDDDDEASESGEFRSLRFDSNDLLKAALEAHGGGAELHDKATPPTNAAVTPADLDDGYAKAEAEVSGFDEQEPGEPDPAPPLHPTPVAVGFGSNSSQAAGSSRLSKRKRRELERKRQQQQKQAAPGGSAAPAASTTSRPATNAKSFEPSQSDVALWESALANPSPVIRRQAARMLKKLTGRDYDV